MAKVGRPNKYFSNVKPRFDDIEKWCRLGVSEAQIAKNLDVGRSNWCDYKNHYQELAELIKDARQSAVTEIKSALFKRALGFSETEKTVITKVDKEGKEQTEVRAVGKYFPPDPASCMILLKHWAKDEEWTQDPQMLEIKKKELKLKKEIAEANNW